LNMIISSWLMSEINIWSSVASYRDLVNCYKSLHKLNEDY
jgi:hypothetical protein